MLRHIEMMLFQFRSCFSREASFNWFVIIVLGFMVRHDHHGLTSIIRCFMLNPKYYDPMRRFFRASSWALNELMAQWVRLAISHYPGIKFNGRFLLIGDGIKLCKEARRMPGVKTLHQDSDNSGKGEYIKGHHIGYVALLAGWKQKFFALPLHGQLHEGIDGIRSDEGFAGKDPTIVTRMARLVVQVAKASGHCCYVALDAYFSTGPAFMIFKEALNEKQEQIVHIITRAKNNYVAYHDCEFYPQKRFHESDKVALTEWFEYPHLFQKVTLNIGGFSKNVEYFCTDLLWKPVEGLVRFVCVKDGEDQFVLMCSDLELQPSTIITIYLFRSKVEVMFLFLKHLLGGFYYHFWTMALPKSNAKQQADFSLLKEKQLEKIKSTVRAMELFVNLAGIALGLLQYIALKHTGEVWENYAGWLRTYSSAIPSERIVQSVIRTEIISSLYDKVPNSRTLQIIRDKMRDPLTTGNSSGGLPLRTYD